MGQRLGPRGREGTESGTYWGSGAPKKATVQISKRASGRSDRQVLQVMLHGGFGPATAGRPRPYGMPPFTLTLNDTEIAAVISHIRNAWGQHAPEVTPLEVLQMRQASSSSLRP